MPVGRGDDRLPRAEGVSERAGGDLRFVQVRREIDIGGADEFLQLIDGGETVVENDLLGDAAFLGVWILNRNLVVRFAIRQPIRQLALWPLR